MTINFSIHYFLRTTIRDSNFREGCQIIRQFVNQMLSTVRNYLGLFLVAIVNEFNAAIRLYRKYLNVYLFQFLLHKSFYSNKIISIFYPNYDTVVKYLQY